jgi:hypothetical protein
VARVPEHRAPRFEPGLIRPDRGERRHTFDTLSPSNPVRRRVRASAGDHDALARSHAIEPNSASERGVSHGGGSAYHGSALPTELRGQKTCKSASESRWLEGRARLPYCRGTAGGNRERCEQRVHAEGSVDGRRSRRRQVAQRADAWLVALLSGPEPGNATRGRSQERERPVGRVAAATTSPRSRFLFCAGAPPMDRTGREYRADAERSLTRWAQSANGDPPRL